MKITPKIILATGLLALAPQLSQAAIAWEGPNRSTAYSGAYAPGSTVTSTATGADFAGIGVDFSATTTGTYAVNASGRQLNFTTAETLLAGDCFTMFFDFSHQIGSGQGGSGAFRRSAVQFNAGSSLDMNVDVLMYGGDETLQDYWAPTTTPTAQHTNPGILEFQDIFISDPSDYIDPMTGSSTRWYGAGPSSAVFTGFSDANTAMISGGQAFPTVMDFDGTDPVSGDANFRYHIVGPQRNATDFNFSGWQFKVTAVEDIPAGSNFLYTFEGIIVDPAIPIPEPASSVLFGLGGLALVLRRKR